MNTEKIKTLEYVHDALEAVESKRADENLSSHEKLDLEKAAVKLRNLERSVIRMVQDELVASLNADADALQQLSDKIMQSSGKLSDIAAVMQKAAKVVEAFTKIVTIAASAGLM